MVNKARTSAFGAGSVSASKFSTGSPVDIPKIYSIAYVGDDTATNTAGGDTITINGSFFKSGCYVYVDRTQASVVSFISSSQITFTAPAKSAGTYTLYVYNPDGGTAIYIPGMNYSGTPTWSTASGSIGTAYETVELSSNVTVLSASSDSTVKYRLYSGSLPTNAVLNTNTGAITGVTSTVAGVTTYTFVIEAYDLENQGTLRTFSITINPDAVTWSSPADGTTITTYEYGSISQALSSSSAIGRSVAYTANTLPTGVNISGNTISGTPTDVGTTNSLITSTATTSNKTATRNINFQINQDVVTWSSPPDGNTVSGYVGTSITQALSSTSAAGRSITYTANTLPTGLSISGSNITGTPTVAQSITSLITATAATTNRFATRILNWIIAVASDLYFPYVSLLLKTTATNTQTNNTFVDSSTNNFTVTRNGTPTQGSFTPHRNEGYWSNYFVISSALSGVPNNMSFGLSTNFTIEAFINWPAAAAGNQTFFELTGGTRMILGRTTTGTRIYWNGTEKGTTYTFTPGTWYHFAIVRNSGTVSCYINGVSAITSFAETVTWATTRFNIAMNSDTAEPMTGYISNLRVVNGTAVYTSAFTPPTTSLTAITNTSLLTCQSNRFRDNSTSNYALTIQTGTPTVQAFQPFNLPASYSVDTYGGSSYFNGSTDYLYVTTPGSSFTFGTGNFTIECWIYLISSGANYKVIWSNRGTDASSVFFGINGGVQLVYYRGGVQILDSTALQFNSWNHVALVRSGSTITLYKNGTSVGSVADSTNLTGPNSVIAQESGGLSTYLNAYLSNLRVVNGTAVYTGTFTPPTAPVTAITNTQLLTNFTNAGIYDASGQSNAITVGTAQVSTTQSKWSPTSLYFNGTTDYLSLQNNGSAFSFSTGNFTIECWIYVTSTASADKKMYSYWSNASESYQFYLRPNNRLVWQIWTQNSPDVAALDVTANTWTHVAMSKSGTTVYLFINGVLKDTTTGVTNSANGGGTPKVGMGTSGEYFPGYIQDLRITKGLARYTTNFSVPTNEFPVR
jgi:hypothetical protein